MHNQQARKREWNICFTLLMDKSSWDMLTRVFLKKGKVLTFPVLQLLDITNSPTSINSELLVWLLKFRPHPITLKVFNGMNKFKMSMLSI